MPTEEVHKSLELKQRAQRTEIAAALALSMGDGNIVELDQQRVGRLSRMDAMAQMEMSRATRARMQKELRRVDAAIARLESGRFGACCRCQESIEASRLQSDPATPFCLPCFKEVSEHREGGAPRR